MQGITQYPVDIKGKSEGCHPPAGGWCPLFQIAGVGTTLESCPYGHINDLSMSSCRPAGRLLLIHFVSIHSQF